MRIISGRWRGRRLLTTKGDAIRPTSDRVKEAVFNIISCQIFGSRVLDLFAGIGSLGLEALSRGASEAIFVDASPEAVSILKKNCSILATSEKYEVIQLDALVALAELISRERSFDVIFMDPPYNTKNQSMALKVISDGNLLDCEGIVVVEHAAGSSQPLEIEAFIKTQERKYGNTGITFYKRGKKINEYSRIPGEF